MPREHRKILWSKEEAHAERNASGKVIEWFPGLEPLRKKKRKTRSERKAARALRGKKGVKLAGYSSYSQYLASPEWSAVRARWMKSIYCRGDKCHTAGCTNVHSLQMHHRTYARIGYEDLSDLVLVCNSCHEKIHALQVTGINLKDATIKVVGY